MRLTGFRTAVVVALVVLASLAAVGAVGAVANGDGTAVTGASGDLASAHSGAPIGGLQLNLAQSSDNVSVNSTVPQPDHVTPDDSIEVNLSVSGADNLTVSASGSFSDTANTSLFVDGENATYGSPHTLENSSDQVSVRVEFEPEYFGEVELEYTAQGPNGTDTVSTGPTVVHHDPLRFPSQAGGEDLQTVLDQVVSNSSIELDNQTISRGSSGLAINQPVTLTAAPNASPVLQFSNRGTGRTSITIESSDVEISGLEIQGGGDRGILIDISSNNVVLENNMLAEAGVGVVLREVTDWEITENQFIDLTTGIEIINQPAGPGGDSLFEYNTLDQIERDGVWVSGGEGESIQIVHNQINITSGAEAGIRVRDDSSAISRISDNGIISSDGQATLIDISDASDLPRIENNLLNGGSIGIDAASVDSSELSGNDIFGAETGIETTDSSAIRIRDTRIENANTGILSQNPTNLTITDTTAPNVTAPIALRSPAANASVDHPNATVEFGSSGEVENLTLGETAFSARGSNVLVEQADTATLPDDRRGVGSALAIANESGAASLNLSIHLDGHNLTAFRAERVQLYRNASDWTSVNGTAVADGRLVATNLTAPTEVQAAVPLGTVAGNVTRPSGAGIGGVTVEIRHGNQTVATRTTANSGAFDATVPADTYEIYVDAENSDPDSTNVTLDRSETANVSLRLDPVEDSGGDDGSGGSGGGGGGGVGGGRQLPVDVSNVQVSNSTVEPGEPITIEATVRNEGDRSGVRRIELVDGLTELDAQSVALTQGEERRVTFEGTLEELGVHVFDVDGQPIATIEVVEDASGSGEGGEGGEGGEPGAGSGDGSNGRPVFWTTAEAPDAVEPGSEATLEVAVQNTGTAPGTADYGIWIDDERVDSAELDLERGETHLADYELDASDPGEVDWELVVDGDIRESGTLVVAEPGDGAEASDDETPGFGVPVALLAVLAGGLAAARRRR